MYNDGEVQLSGDQVVLRYNDPRGRPRQALLMYCLKGDAVWIKPRITIKIGTLETDADGHRYLKIPID